MRCNAIVHLVNSKINTVIKQPRSRHQTVGLLFEWKPHNNDDSQAASTTRDLLSVCLPRPENSSEEVIRVQQG
jgi:hypothetical protein